MKKKQWKGKAALRDSLQQQLPVLAAEYFAAGRIGLSEESTWEDMHAFRLKTKRFRYTLEIFREAYGPGLERRIEVLKSLQTLLGDINDCVVTSGMLCEIAGTEAVREKLADRARKWTEKLRRFWSADFDAPGQEARWVRYLAQYACRPAPVPRARRLPAPEPPG